MSGSAAVSETSAIPDYTSGNGKTFPAARDDLPLTVDKLIAIAMSRLWTDRVARSISAAGETLTSFNLLDGMAGGE